MREQPASPAKGSPVIDIAVTGGLLIMGIYFFISGTFQYGVWVNRGPGPGFFGAIIGAGLALCAASHLVRRSGWLATRVDPIAFLPVLGLVVAVLSIPYLGMAEALTIFVLLWVGLMDKRGWLLTLFIGVLTFLAIEIGFGQWLGVFLPDGLLSSFFRS